MAHELSEAAIVGEPGTAEADLVARAKARSRQAWTEIYEAHSTRIYRYLKARVFDEAMAEDLTSAVFLAALKGIEGYRYQGRPLLAWLYRIARNVVADHQRQLLMGRRHEAASGPPHGDMSPSSRRRMIPLSSGDAAHLADSKGDPVTILDNLDLNDAIQKLPATQREVLVLRFFVGLSVEEIGEAIGKGPAAVYSLQARAILALRKRLA